MTGETQSQHDAPASVGRCSFPYHVSCRGLGDLAEIAKLTREQHMSFITVHCTVTAFVAAVTAEWYTGLCHVH